MGPSGRSGGGGSGFAAMRRTAIVNMERIESLAHGEAGDVAVQLDSEQEVPVSRRYRRALRERVEAGGAA